MQMTNSPAWNTSRRPTLKSSLIRTRWEEFLSRRTRRQQSWWSCKLASEWMARKAATLRSDVYRYPLRRKNITRSDTKILYQPINSTFPPINSRDLILFAIFTRANWQGHPLPISNKNPSKSNLTLTAWTPLEARNQSLKLCITTVHQCPLMLLQPGQWPSLARPISVRVQ